MAGKKILTVYFYHDSAAKIRRLAVFERSARKCETMPASLVERGTGFTVFHVMGI